MEAAELELLFPFQSTPLMRGETVFCRVVPPPIDISIHSPHARGDDRFVVTLVIRILFQSTPLMRGETNAASVRTIDKNHFNPLPSCEGRPKGNHLQLTIS